MFIIFFLFFHLCTSPNASVCVLTAMFLGGAFDLDDLTKRRFDTDSPTHRFCKRHVKKRRQKPSDSLIARVSATNGELG